MTPKPNSDKSGRATRRREEREVAQAQRTVARAGASTPVGLDINALLAKTRATIGDLTMERDALQVQVEQQRKQIEILLGAGIQEEETPAEEEEEEKVEAEGPPKGKTVE